MANAMETESAPTANSHNARL